MFTCGGGGSDKWIYKNAATVADTTTATSYSNLSITDIDTDTYADPIFDASAAYAGVPVFTPKKYHWQVGSCNEMLMLVSAIDNNGVMSQKKVAILSR